jgi:hypothetical protein
VQILHPRLEIRKLAAEIRKPRSALVEQNQTKGVRESLVEVAPERVLPVVDKVRNIVRNQDEVDLPVTDHRVGDRDTAVPDVPDVELHGWILHPVR